MRRDDGTLCVVLIAQLAAGCAAPDDGLSEASHQGDLRALHAHSAPRPDGWDESSHGKHAGADYARVFADGVQRIDIAMSAETHAFMFADLSQRVGGPGTGSNRSPLAIATCAGRVENEPCRFLDVSGNCTPAGAVLACEADDQQGPLDLVPGDPVAVPVTIRYEGKVWNHVAMRFKGNSSLSTPFRAGGRKLPLRLDFDALERAHEEVEDQRFWGFDELTFASAYSDPSLIREKLAADVMREAGLKVARTAFYRVFVDVGGGPEYWGLYTLIEDPSDRMLEAQFADGSGNLYKPDGDGAEFTHFDPKTFEKKTNEKAGDYSDVLRAIAALNAPRDDAPAWRASLEAALDVESFLRTLAVSRALDHWDSYGIYAHNYYLYGDPSAGGRLVWISWDHNLTLAGGRGRSSLLLGQTSASWPLIHFLLADPVYRERYRTLLRETVEGAFEKARFDALAARLSAQVAPYVVGPEGERAPYTNLPRAPESLAPTVAQLIAAADARRTAIVAALAPPPVTPPPATPPVTTPPATPTSAAVAPAEPEAPTREGAATTAQ